jgi:hypothetical protein
MYNTCVEELVIAAAVMFIPAKQSVKVHRTLCNDPGKAHVQESVIYFKATWIVSGPISELALSDKGKQPPICRREHENKYHASQFEGKQSSTGQKLTWTSFCSGHWTDR